MTPQPSPSRPRVSWLAWFAITLAVSPILALALFYPIENWRGKRAWEKCRQALAAKGERLDWEAYLPSPVPDELNVFKAPHMAEWFLRRGTNELARRLDPGNLQSFCARRGTNVVAELTVVMAGAAIAPGKADLVLRYDAPVLRLEAPENAAEPEDPRFVKIPVIEFRDVPLLVAIENLARQAGVNYLLDPRVGSADPGRPGPPVTSRWEQASAFQVLIAILDKHGLHWIDDPKTGIARVTRNNPGSVRSTYVDNQLREQIQALVQNSLSTTTGEGSPGQTLAAAQRFKLTLTSPSRATPARVLLKTDQRPSREEVQEFFPTNVVSANGEVLGLRVEPAGDDFRVVLNSRVYAAADYLAWSDQFGPDFDAMRAALNRPLARIEGDHRQPFTALPDFIAYRQVVQTLSQRAQCFLLLNQPDAALRELTLMHRLTRTLEEKPNLVVGAMIETAIAGLYVGVVAEGLGRHTWREPQLAVLQEQLRQINLPLLLAKSLRAARAGLLQILASGQPEIFAEVVNQGSPRRRVDLVSHRSWLPRGWQQQNYVVFANLHQTLIESVDVTNQLVVPTRTRNFSAELTRLSSGFHPHTFIVANSMMDCSRAVALVAFQQTCLDETGVACALERHRLAVGELPETLAALCPRFLEPIPHDLIGGQPLKYRREGGAGFVLYSVGWNETDDGGTAYKSGLPEQSQTDWVWQSPGGGDGGQLTAK